MIKIRETVICWVIFLAIISANLILGTVHVWAAGQTAVTANSKTDDTTVQRQELKNEIDKYSEKNAGKAVPAIKKLLSLENPDDVTYLLDIAAKNIKSPITKEILKIISTYNNKEYLITALKKAGQDKSADINVMAANLLIDMKEELKGLKVMVAMIKKGVIDKRVIDIMDRVPNRAELNGVKVDGEKIIYNSEIQSELSWVGTTKTYPKEVQVFALLMQSAYYEAYLHDLKGKILEVLTASDHNYLRNALDLLKKTLVIYKYDSSDILDLVSEISKSKDKEIAKIAKEILGNKMDKMITKSHQMITNQKLEELPGKLQEIYGYLYKYGDTKENVSFLIRALQKEKNSEARVAIMKTLRTSKQRELTIPVFEEVASNKTISNEKVWAIHSLIMLGAEEDAFKALPVKRDRMIFNLVDNPNGNVFARFAKTKIRTKVAKYLMSIRDESKNENIYKIFAAISLLMFDEEVKQNLEIINQTLNKNDFSETDVHSLMDALIQSAAINSNQINNILDVFGKAKQSENKYVSTAAEETLVKVKKMRWWRNWNKKK